MKILKVLLENVNISTKLINLTLKTEFDTQKSHFRAERMVDCGEIMKVTCVSQTSFDVQNSCNYVNKL